MDTGLIDSARPRSHRGHRGFTLLEVLVSMAVISIALVAVFKLYSQTILMNLEANFFVSAPLLAKAKLAEIEALLPETPTDGSGGFGDGYPDYTWQVSVDDVVSETLGETAEDLKQIEVTVSFMGGKRRFYLKTFRFIR